MTDTLQVDIWSDVMCPWCAVGYTQFAAALDQLEGEIEAQVRWMPFELNPDMPPEGRSQADHLAQAYARSPDEVAAMRAQMSETAAQAGYPMDYTGSQDVPPEPMMWNTLDAHKLLRWTLATHDGEKQTALKLALFDAHFRQRRNVSDRAVLLDIAQSIGLDRQAAGAALDDEALTTAIRLEEKRAADNRITSVPTFVVNGRYVLQGANDPERFRSALLKLANMEAAA